MNASQTATIPLPLTGANLRDPEGHDTISWAYNAFQGTAPRPQTVADYARACDKIADVLASMTVRRLLLIHDATEARTTAEASAAFRDEADAAWRILRTR